MRILFRVSCVVFAMTLSVAGQSGPSAIKHVVVDPAKLVTAPIA